MEKNCKWHFGKEGGIDIGPNDPIHQTFKGNPYYSIVREAIQNSLDAVNDDSLPVSISFQYFDLDRIQYPSFFELEDHIRQSSDYYSSNSDAQRLFGGMLNYLNGSSEVERKSKISCLKISDSNTKGMYYADGTDSPFYAFLRAAGVSSKKLIGSGGSFGFGKGAYFALSPIKTLVVSTKDLNGNVYFEGATRLTTHKNGNDEKLTAYGFYDNNSGQPTTIEERVPELFMRKEVGTDINVIGLWDEYDRDSLMVKSVLNNFWLAIHECKLIVTINSTNINKDNLENVIDKYFSNEFESGNATEFETWNPKPYYRAVKYSNSNDQYRFFTDDLDILGEVKLYVYLQKGLPNRTAYFRKPKMVVFKRTNRKLNGYVAVFVCNCDKGNEILRMMENPAHNEWKKENFPSDEGHTSAIARKAENEYSEYVNRKLDSLAKLNTSRKVVFLGLEEFLSIPEDLLEKDEVSDLTGDNKNITSGTPTNEITNEETGLQTTNIAESITIKPSIKVQKEVKTEDNADAPDDGDNRVATGGENDGDGGLTRPNDGDSVIAGSNSDDAIQTRVFFKVKLKVAAQRENGVLYHYLIISVDKNIPNAELDLRVSGDNDDVDGLSIVTTDNGFVEGNKLKGVSLMHGANQIRIRFEDNLKHSIKIKAYEI